jgi:hypothetical protein
MTYQTAAFAITVLGVLLMGLFGLIVQRVFISVPARPASSQRMNGTPQAEARLSIPEEDRPHKDRVAFDA